MTTIPATSGISDQQECGGWDPNKRCLVMELVLFCFILLMYFWDFQIYLIHYLMMACRPVLSTKLRPKTLMRRLVLALKACHV